MRPKAKIRLVGRRLRTSARGLYSRFTRVTFHVPLVTLGPATNGAVEKVPSIVCASAKAPSNVVVT